MKTLEIELTTTLETFETELTTTLETELTKTLETKLTTTLETNQEGLPWGIIGAGIGSLFIVMLVVVVVCYCCGCCEKKKSKATSDAYHRVSIDSNLQYGEDYHNEKRQTRVVDKNEMYVKYEQD